MTGQVHATDLLMQPNDPSDVPVLVLYGPERSLKLDVLHRIPGCADTGNRSDEGEGDDEAEFCFSRMEGDEVELSDVTDELLTVSMFGDRRIVLVENADGFVKTFRSGLERYLDKPARTSLLILDVKSWPKNTKLARRVSQIGLAVECGTLSGSALVNWLQNLAVSRYEKQIDKDTASLMVSLAGDDLGILQQELSKLASLTGDTAVITSEDVRQAVGDWRVQTTWAMLDAVRDGQVGEAIVSLNRLLASGEAAPRIMGGISFVFRKFAEATERARQTRDVRSALTAAGVFPSAVTPAEAYLRRIGYGRASRILQLLADTDAELKGGSRVDEQRQLERLLVRLGR